MTVMASASSFFTHTLPTVSAVFAFGGGAG